MIYTSIIQQSIWWSNVRQSPTVSCLQTTRLMVALPPKLQQKIFMWFGGKIFSNDPFRVSPNCKEEIEPGIFTLYWNETWGWAGEIHFQIIWKGLPIKLILLLPNIKYALSSPHSFQFYINNLSTSVPNFLKRFKLKVKKFSTVFCIVLYFLC